MSRSRFLSRLVALALTATGAVLVPAAAPAQAAPATCVTTYAAPGLKTIAARSPTIGYSVGWVDIEVSDPRVVVDVDYGFDVSSGDGSGLAFSLDGPQSVGGAPRATAEDAAGAINGSFVIDDEAPAPFARTSPPSGRYRPSRPASQLDGTSAAGRWRTFVSNVSDATGSWGNVTLTLTVDCDADKDGLADDVDNCPSVANPDQAAIDDDSLGDACDLDADGDSLTNTTDGCPAAAATTSSGCPTVGRTARLRYAKASRRLRLTVGSEAPGCRDGAQATLFRVKRGKDLKLLVATTDRRGRAQIKAPRRPGRYYVRIAASYAPGEAECAQVRSDRARTTRGATPRLPAAVDTDGDGLDDSIDGCPGVASGNPTGCPSASRTVSLKRLPGTHRLQAQVTSPVNACAARARIKLFLDRSSGSDKLLASDASFQGRRRFTVPGGARYYVVVTPSYSSGVAECGKAVSRKVRVPR